MLVYVLAGCVSYSRLSGYILGYDKWMSYLFTKNIIDKLADPVTGDPRVKL